MNDNSTGMNVLLDYLDGALEGAALTAFEERLATDTRLRTEVDKLRDVRDAVKRYGLKEKVAAIRQDMKKEGKVEPGGKFRLLGSARWWMAAAVVFLLAVGLYQYLGVTPSGLYGKLHEPYTVPATRGQGSGSGLVQAYKDKKYDLVLSLFDKNATPGVEDYFYAGNAALELGNAGRAINAFLQLLEIDRRTGVHSYEEAAEYYLGLSYLAAGRTGDALPLFEKIHQDPLHPHHDRVSWWSLQRLRWLRSRQ